MNKSKKIIFTVSSDLCTDQRMQRICGSLHKEGYRVQLVGRYLKRKASFPFDSKQIRCLFNKGFSFYAEFNLRLFFYLLFQKSDAICSIDLDTILPGKIISKLKSWKHIYDAHEYFTESPEIDGRPSIKAFWEWVGRVGVSNLDLAYTVNKTIAELLMDKYNEDFKVVRNLPLSQLNKISEKENSFIFYQGVLNKGRGLENLILAMKEIEGVRLIIAGRGDLDDVLRSLVLNNELEEKVSFLGIISPEEVKSYSEKALIGFNLLDGTNKNYYFSLANKFFDYMMSGLPSICMDFPEYRQINDQYDFSLLIKDIEIKTIVRATKSLLQDPQKLQLLKKNALVAREKLNWQQEEIVLKTLYSDLLLSTE